MDRVRLAQILLSVAGISVGQVLLKLAALASRNASAQDFGLVGQLLNGYLIAGVAVLGCSTLLWTWVLRSVPLSSAYPYMALAFVLVPLICYFLLGEGMTVRQVLGSALICAGVVVVSQGA